MADILQFRPRLNVFAPELTSAMGNAYDKAIASSPDNQAELAVLIKEKARACARAFSYRRSSFVSYSCG